MARQSIVALLVLVSATVTVACTQVVAESSACRNLTYKDGEVARDAYLPCVGETMAALDELDRQTAAALGGDRQARLDGQSTLKRAIALRKAAGGMQLLERWNDRALTNLNVDIHNALTHYDAFYMVRILEEPNQFAAQSHAAAKSEYDNAHRRYLEAGRLYRFLK